MYATWDTETTIASSFKRKANPFNDANYVVTHAVKHKGEQVKEYRFGRQRPNKGWLDKVLFNDEGKPIQLLIGMNLKFDLHHALNDADNWLHLAIGVVMVVLGLTLAGTKTPTGADGEPLVLPEDE